MNTFKNNLKATLYYDMTASDTVIWLNQLVTSSDALTRLAAWPTCDATHTFTLTLASTIDSNVLEVVECTGVTANTADYISFTCTRAKEGTTAIAHGKNTTTVENRLTAEALATIVTAIASVTTTATTTSTRVDTLGADVSALSSTILGSIQSILATDSYIPNGCVPANGAEYTRAQFPTLYDTYLVGGKFLTCTYTEFATQLAASGNCAKFAVDTTNQKFKVPCLKDGDSITQASSAAEVGKSYKAGLPNITGRTGGFRADVVNSGCIRASGIVDTIIAIPGLSSGYQPAIDASEGGTHAVYGKSTTVTDEQVRLRHFVVVASAQNNASVFDWSNYMAGLAGKANLNMDNLTQVGTTAIAHYSRLSGRYINVTAWLNGSTYTAPADGAIYWVSNISTSAVWYNEAKNMTTDMAVRQNGINQTTVSRITLDVRKGDVVNFYADSGNPVVSRFYYAEGAY